MVSLEQIFVTTVLVFYNSEELTSNIFLEIQMNKLYQTNDVLCAIISSALQINCTIKRVAKACPCLLRKPSFTPYLTPP